MLQGDVNPQIDQNDILLLIQDFLTVAKLNLSAATLSQELEATFYRNKRRPQPKQIVDAIKQKGLGFILNDYLRLYNEGMALIVSV